MAELEEGWKWWLRYIIVPVIAGSGLIGIVVTLLVKQNSANSERAISSQRSVADVQSETKKRDDAIRALRLKGPPFAYRLTENCTVLWTNYNSKRIWVRDPQGLAA